MGAAAQPTPRKTAPPATEALTPDWIRAYIAKRVEEALLGVRAHVSMSGGPRAVLERTASRDHIYATALKTADTALLELGLDPDSLRPAPNNGEHP
jgi:hypothetical protein